MSCEACAVKAQTSNLTSILCCLPVRPQARVDWGQLRIASDAQMPFSLILPLRIVEVCWDCNHSTSHTLPYESLRTVMRSKEKADTNKNVFMQCTELATSSQQREFGQKYLRTDIQPSSTYLCSSCLLSSVQFSRWPPPSASSLSESLDPSAIPSANFARHPMSPTSNTSNFFGFAQVSAKRHGGNFLRMKLFIDALVHHLRLQTDVHWYRAVAGSVQVVHTPNRKPKTVRDIGAQQPLYILHCFAHHFAKATYCC